MISVPSVAPTTAAVVPPPGTKYTAALMLPPLVVELERQRALANLRVLPLTTRDPRRLIEQGDCDLAVGYFPEAIAHIDAQGSDATMHHARLAQTRPGT